MNCAEIDNRERQQRANRAGYVKYAARRACQILEYGKEGYVKKQPPRQDRRSKILTFTEEGQRYADGILLRLYDIEGTALYNMNPEVRTALLDGFDAFLEVLRQAFEDEES